MKPVNYLIILVTTKISLKDLSENFKFVHDFCENLIKNEVFRSINGDIFIIYIEDLFFRDVLNSFFIPELKMFFRHYCIPERNFKIVFNLRKYISDNLKILQESEELFPLSDLESLLNYYYQYAQMAIAPTLIKELLQPVGLHIETNLTSRSTVYHDLDMRYTCSKADLNPSSVYSEAPKAQLPWLNDLPSDFDVFWGLNVPDANKTYLKVFYNILCNTVYQSPYLPEGHLLRTKIAGILKIIPSQIKTLTDSEEPIAPYYRLDRFLYQDLDKSIFELHKGYCRQIVSESLIGDRCNAVMKEICERIKYPVIVGVRSDWSVVSDFFSKISPHELEYLKLLDSAARPLPITSLQSQLMPVCVYGPSAMQYRFLKKSIGRKSLPYHFIPMYVKPFREYFDLKSDYPDKQKSIDDHGLNITMFTRYEVFKKNRFSFTDMSFRLEEFGRNKPELSDINFSWTPLKCFSLSLEKVIRSNWLLVPELNENELRGIIEKCPHMAHVLRITQSFRELSRHPLTDIKPII